MPPTPEKVADQPISILEVLTVVPPAGSSGKTSPLTVTAAATASHTHPHAAVNMNPIVQLLRDQKLGKALLGFVIPMTGVLLPVYSKNSLPLQLYITLMSICIGLAALWNGLLLRNLFPKLANAIEQLGAVFIFYAFYGVVGSFLTITLVWFSWVCFSLCLLPIAFSYLPDKSTRASSSSEVGDQSLKSSSSVSKPHINLNPIVQLLHDKEIGKTVLGFVIPMTGVLLPVYTQNSSPVQLNFTLMSLCIGLAALWNGILLRDMLPKLSNGIEQLGAAAIFSAFYGVVGSFMSPCLAWVSWFCFSVSLLPLFLSYLPTGQEAELMPAATPDTPASNEARETRSTTSSAGGGQTRTLNPIAQLLRDQELGKTVLGFAIPMTGILLPVYAKNSSPFELNITLASLCIGLAALWNGVLLREMFPKLSTGIEQLGAVSIFLAFYVVMGAFLPPALVWLSWVCFTRCFLPITLSYLPTTKKANNIPISLPSEDPKEATPPCSTSSAIGSQPHLNPINKLFQDQELGKTALGFIIPMTGILLPVYAKSSSPLQLYTTLMSLCIGLAALWNGILLREMFPKFSSALELLGAASIFLSFYEVVGSFLPPTIVWVSWSCFIICLLPIALSYLLPGQKVEQVSSTTDHTPPSSDNPAAESPPPQVPSPCVASAKTSTTNILNPIVHVLRDQELGKAVLGFVVPMTGVLLPVFVEDSSALQLDRTLLSLCIGLAALWDGILLGNMFPKFATAIEQIGAASIFLAFFGVIGSPLPQTLAWVAWVCFALCLLPFALSYLPTTKVSNPT